MSEIELTARRIAFLERELERMASEAADAEDGLRLNPTGPTARRRLEAIYALVGQTWDRVKELRASQADRYALIRFDHEDEAMAKKSWRQALG